MHHGHSHGSGINEKTDNITNAGAFGELVEAGANLFVGMELYNILYELRYDEENDILLGPLFVGSVLALVSIGSAFTHDGWILIINELDLPITIANIMK